MEQRIQRNNTDHKRDGQQRNRDPAPFQIVHMDICRPLHFSALARAARLFV